MSFLSGVQGEAPVADAFSAYSRPQNASCRKKNVIFWPKCKCCETTDLLQSSSVV